MKVFDILLKNYRVNSRVVEIMANPGDLQWGAPGWSSADIPDKDGAYVIHYAWDATGPEFVGIDRFMNGRWNHRWTKYPRFEWCSL